MQADLINQDLNSVENYKSLFYYTSSRVDLANFYAEWMLEKGEDGKWLMLRWLGDDFCKMMDGVIEFNLFKTGKKLEEVKSIKFYECQNGRRTNTLISRIRFK